MRRQKCKQRVVFDSPLQFETPSFLNFLIRRLVRPSFGLLALIGVMALATYLTTSTIERFNVTEPLLEYETFDADLADWKINEASFGGVIVTEGVVAVEQYSATGHVGLSREIKLAPGDKYLRLTGTVSGEDIIPGEKNWEAARIIYLELDESGNHNRRKRHELVSLDGTESEQNYSVDFALSATTKALRISIQLHKTVGRMEVSRLALHRLELSEAYKVSRFWLFSGWSVLLLLGVFLLFRSASTVASGVFMLVASAVFVLGILSPGSINSHLFTWIEETAGVSRDHIEYAAHFLGFMLFGVLLKILQARRPLLILIAVCLVVSLVSEVLQLMTLDRSFQYIDLIINFFGAIFGVILGFVTLRVGRVIHRWRYSGENALRQTEEEADDEFTEEIESVYQDNDVRQKD